MYFRILLHTLFYLFYNLLFVTCQMTQRLVKVRQRIIQSIKHIL